MKEELYLEQRLACRQKSRRECIDNEMLPSDMHKYSRKGAKSAQGNRQMIGPYAAQTEAKVSARFKFKPVRTNIRKPPMLVLKEEADTDNVYQRFPS